MAMDFDPRRRRKTRPPVPVGTNGRSFGEAPRALGGPVTDAQVVEPEIPELQKKEEEKRRGGIAWVSGSPGSAQIAVGGGRAALGGGGWGFLGSTRIAAGLARLFGRTWVGAFFATSPGRAFVGLGMAVWAALMVAAGYSLYTGGWHGRGEDSAARLPSLGPIDPSGIAIKRPRNRSLDYVARANSGEILFDPEHPMGPKPGEAGAEAKDAAAPDETALPKPPEAVADPGAGAGGRGPGESLREGFIRKLTQNTSELFGGGGGPKISNQGGIAGKFSLKSARLPKLTPRKKLTPLARLKRSYGATPMSSRKGYSSRAMGQLKLARNMSAAGAATPADTGARQYATDAFEQSASRGGELSPIGSSGGGGPNPIVVPPGTGAPPDIPPPDIPPGTNVTPYQPQLEAAKGMGQMAGMLKMLGIMLMILGVVLMAIGYSLMTPPTTEIGVALIAVGVLLLAMGAMMLMQAGSMANMGKGMGKGIGQGYGQKEQGKVVEECVDQAYQNNTNPDDCQPSTQVDQKKNTVHEDVEAERNADYRLEGGADGSQ